MSNEIVAYFKGRVGVAESLYQYDYGYVMAIDGLDLQNPFEVHFEHSGDVESVTAIGSDYRVAIPNRCLAVPGDVTAYIYEHTGKFDGETEYVVRFRVMRRARPVDDATEEQESAISRAIALLLNTNATIYEKMDDYFDSHYRDSVQERTDRWLNDHPDVYNTQVEVDDDTLVVSYAGDIRAYLYEHPEFLTTQTDVEDDTLVLFYTGALTEND